MDLRKYIKELLYDHECVIIPGFGGFITSYSPARIDRPNRLVYPPSKSISFNKQLQSNDGLLLNYITKREACTYDDAANKLIRFVEGCKRSLKSRGVVAFPDVGRIYLNFSDNLVFLPDHLANYLRSSYGLKPAAILTPELPDKETVAHAKTERKAETTTGSKEKERSPIKRRQRRQYGRELTIAVLLLLLFSQLMIWDISPEKLRLQNLELFSISKISERQPEIAPIISSKMEGIQPELKLRMENKEATPEIHSPNNPKTGFYIIVGSFKGKENANKLMDRLIGKGYSASILKAENNFHRVGIFTRGDHDAATNKLDSYKKEFGTSIWIYRNS